LNNKDQKEIEKSIDESDLPESAKSTLKYHVLNVERIYSEILDAFYSLLIEEDTEFLEFDEELPFPFNKSKEWLENKITFPEGTLVILEEENGFNNLSIGFTFSLGTNNYKLEAIVYKDKVIEIKDNC